MITGGLGVGKTSLLSLLNRQYETVAEPARELVSEHRETSDDATLDQRPELFVEKLISRSIEKYTTASSSAVTVFDRGVPDCVAYAMAYELDIGTALDAASRYPYENSVFIASPWEEIYTTDDMRRATFAQAETFYTYVVEAYQWLGYQMIELPKASVDERAALVVDYIEDRV
ncbi:MAG: ATP-binding protein [Acidimicrobiia bacterium]